MFAALAALQDQLDDLVAVVTAQQRTLETLLTAPIRDWQVVAGKYVGAVLFYRYDSRGNVTSLVTASVSGS